ncbi:Myblike DNAbinding domain-containing protein [Porites harrisoni]
MSTSKAEDRDVSERKLLVDDIERIRQVLHTGAASKLSSDEEEEEESDEDGQEGCREVFLGSTSVNLQHQIDAQLALEQNSQVAFPGTVLEPVYVGQQSSFNAGQDSSAQGVSDVLSHHQLANSNLFPAHRSGNLCSDDYTITELQPVNCQPSTSSLPNVSYSNVSSSFTNVPSTSDPCTSLSSANQEGFNNSTWPAVDNQFFDPRDVEGLDQEEDGPFSDGEEENIEDMEMRNKIQQCLILNRDYQIAVLDELERIELALAKNKEKQLGLHQMRANKDEGKPEGHTLMKFAYPYFRDTGLVGPPDNEDTKVKRQTCQVDGYLIQEKIWNAKEKERLAEGVKMQNLENKLSPILQKIQKLELKNVKTNSDLKELEDLKAESRRIKSIPKDKLAYDLEGIDWDKISSIYVPKRTSFQCRLQWCNFDHPDVNRTPWTKDEDKKLLQLAKDPNMTWVDIAQTLQTKRTPIHCYERYQRSLNKNLLKSKWTPEDDKLLLDVVRVVGVGNWARVASFLEGRQGDQCMHRYTQTLQMVRKGKWTEEEDELLRKAIEKYGTSWNKLSEMVPGRSGPQCRERWVNALDPKIDKGAWTKIQDQKLLENVEKFGQGNWSKIARAIGNRTDNQCWRRWIVLRKDDFLYYRQNTLRKKRELVANFTGRRQERPSLRPEDLDIPDVPVVKKARGRIPLPPEESRERRRLTRQRFREKKRAEKIRAEEEAKAKMVQEAEETEAANEDEQEESEDMRDDNEEVKEVAKKPRNRKAGVNRARIQQPHSRELMKNSPTKRELMKNSPTKRRNIGEMKRKNQKGASAEDKTSAVSGFLGPFSLLLQAFSIDIPTVLKAIQNTSTNPASSHTNVTTTAEPSVSLENTAAVDEQKEQAGDATRKQQSQASHDPGKSQLPSSNISQSNMHREASDGMLENQTRGDQGRQRNLQNAESDLQLPKEKSNMGDHQGNKHPNKGNTPIGLQSARNDNGTTAAKPMSATPSATSQAPRTRAPAIPPLPPSFTTLRTFKALLQLRPELQRIAALLNPSPECGTARSQAHQPPLASACQAVPSGNHGNKESGAPRVIRDVASEKDKQTMSKLGDSEISSSEHGVVTVARAVGAKPSNNVKESTGLCVSVGNITTDDTSKTGITQQVLK